LDRDLIELARHGDESAFATLAGSICDRLSGVAQHILRDQARADDATQEALIEIWRRLPTLRDPGCFEAWSYRILVRSAYAEARRRQRWAFLAGVLGPWHASEPDHAGWFADHDELDRALSSLPLDHRAVIVLKHYAGLSNAEIAEALGVPEGTVRSRLHYALRSLQAAVAADARPATGASAP
jgi:RNA polymerase sigma-70 factor (ECF subfamily)